MRDSRIHGGTDKAVSTYSAGNYKKTAFATLLIDKPKFLYLDEPFETVDIISKKTMLDIIIQLSEGGADIILTTQDVDLCQQFDYVKIFSKLEIVAEGKPSTVLGKNPLKSFLDLAGAQYPAISLNWLR